MSTKREKQVDTKTSMDKSEPAPKRQMRSSSSPMTKSNKSSPSEYTDVDITNAIYFWREYGSEHCFLSQWYRSDFTTDEDHELVYKSAEQYMMYHKAVLFKDSAVAQKILATTDPKKIKNLGKQVHHFTNEIWDANKDRVVEEASYFKFKNGKAVVDGEEQRKCEVRDLRKALLDTGERLLVEASPFDRIWGVGFDPKSAPGKRERWGLNLLGKALMKARMRLREEEMAERNVDGEVLKHV